MNSTAIKEERESDNDNDEILEDIFREIEENQEEEFKKNNPQFFIEDEHQENDLLDDSDFVEVEQMNKDDLTFAQHFFEQ